jgi:starch phosphorylase
MHPDPDYQDRLDANSLYDLLEREIIPRFYDRSEGPVPRRWIERVKTSVAGLGTFVTADRMLREYVDKLYQPASGKARDLSARGYTRVRDLASWRARVREAWGDVQVIDVDGDMTEAGVGEERNVTARVRTGRLSTDDLAVQLSHGRVGANGELIDPTFTAMTPGDSEDGVCSFSGSFVAAKAGLYGFAVRVVPAHTDLTSEVDLGLVAWA